MVGVIVEIYDWDNNMYDVSSRIKSIETTASLEKPCTECSIEFYHNVINENNNNLPIYIQPRI